MWNGLLALIVVVQARSMTQLSKNTALVPLVMDQGDRLCKKLEQDQSLALFVEVRVLYKNHFLYFSFLKSGQIGKIKEVLNV